MARVLRIRNWSKYQHYKDRNPPWIKLHVEILASEDWVLLDDASKLLAVVCMVIGAKSKEPGEVPDNPDYIKRVAYLATRPNLTPLIECGFLEIAQADAGERKQVLASACPEKETDPETELPKQTRAKVRRSLPEDFPFEADRSWALERWLQHGRTDLANQLSDEIGKFRDHHTAKATLSADWSASWRTWAQNAIRFNNGGHNGRAERKPTAHDNFNAGIASYFAKRGEGGAESPEPEANRGDPGSPRRPLLAS